MPKKIALTGLMRSGKDEVAKYLADKYGFARVAFGDGIRDVCKLMYPEIMKAGKKPRHLLQTVGQDARKHDEGVWVKWAFRRIDSLPYADLVVSDLRQPNELVALRDAGFKVIRLKSHDGNRIKRMIAAGDDFSKVSLLHPTEQYVNQFIVDAEIHNDGSLDDLHAQIDALLIAGVI